MVCTVLLERERERERFKGEGGGHEGSTVARSRQGFRSDFRKKILQKLEKICTLYLLFFVLFV